MFVTRLPHLAGEMQAVRGSRTWFFDRRQFARQLNFGQRRINVNGPRSGRIRHVGFDNWPNLQKSSRRLDVVKPRIISSSIRSEGVHRDEHEPL